jgi:uncharacterized delta-60 repeat protein
MPIRILFSVLLLLILGRNAFAQLAGDLDPTFNTDGYYTNDGGSLDNLQDVTVLPNGKILATGVSFNPNFAGSRLVVLRSMPDGTPDATFDGDGKFEFELGSEQYGYAVEGLPNGQILVAGGVSDPSGSLQLLLMRLNEDGSSDISFALGGFNLVDNFDGGEDIAQAMTVQSDGKILLAGYIHNELQQSIPAVYRFTDTGFLDETFGTGGLATVPVEEVENEFTTIAVRPDGKIVATGHYSIFFNIWGFLVAQFDENGVLDPTFGPADDDFEGFTVRRAGPNWDESNGMQFTPEGDIVIAGTTMTEEFTLQMCIAKFSAGGVLDATFGTNGFTIYGEAAEDVAMDCVLLPDSKILAGGSSGAGAISGNLALALWRFTADGAMDPTFNTDGMATIEIGEGVDDINALALQSDGKLLAAGRSHNGTDYDFMIARFFTTGTVGIDENGSTNLFLAPNPVVPGGTIRFGVAEGLTLRSMEILDAAGHLAATIPVNAGSNSVTIPSSLSEGAYAVRSVDARGQRSASARLMIAR